MVKSDLEVHFFHGFLGRPDDWQSTLTFMPHFLKSANIFQHDLLKDCQNLEPLTFENWAREIEIPWRSSAESMQAKSPQRILIGYSLGGRLCLHLNPQFYDYLFLIAVHPGLQSGFAEREQQDQMWAETLIAEDADSWLQRWNKQMVFGQDRVRPKRTIQGDQVRWSKILKCFSLSQQSCKEQMILAHKDKIHWFIGEKDLKYQTLKGPMKRLLGEERIVQIPDAGHGVLFDQPKLLAQAIFERCSDVV